MRKVTSLQAGKFDMTMHCADTPTTWRQLVSHKFSRQTSTRGEAHDYN